MRTHTHMYARLHAHVCTHILYVRTSTYTHAHIHVHTHTSTHAHMHIDIHAYDTHSQTLLLCAYVYACILHILMVVCKGMG